MTNPAVIQAYRDRITKAVEKVWDTLTVEEPFVTTDTDLGARVRLPKADIRAMREAVVALEPPALRTRKISEPRPGRRGPGIATEWTITTPVNVTKARLAATWRKADEHTAELMSAPNPLKGNRRGRPRKATPAPGSGWTNGSTLAGLDIGRATPDHPVVPDTLVASAGPEPVRAMAAVGPGRKDEAQALIEAARQYANVNRELDKKVKELEDLGMTVDRQALAKAIKAPHDHRLLIVSSVLPYIEQIERQVDRLTTQNEDLRTKNASLPDLTLRVNRLHESNTRLVSENAQLRQQLSDRGVSGPRIPPATRTPVTAGKD